MGKKKDEQTGEQANPTGEKGRKGRLLPAVVVAVGLLGGGYLVGGGKGHGATPASAAGAAGAGVTGPTTTTTAPAGEIVPIDPITLNLADGHVLKVGLALQLSKKAKADVMTKESAKALDQAISLLGERTMSQLAAPGGRADAKQELSNRIAHVYDGNVLGIYFTEFVMQ